MVEDTTGCDEEDAGGRGPEATAATRAGAVRSEGMEGEDREGRESNEGVDDVRASLPLQSSERKVGQVKQRKKQIPNGKHTSGCKSSGGSRQWF